MNQTQKNLETLKNDRIKIKNIDGRDTPVLDEAIIRLTKQLMSTE